MGEFNLGAKHSRRHGQAMVEYALILVLLAVAFGVAIAATGPAIGNVFCNVVHNIGGSTADPQGGTCGSTAPNLANDGGNPPLFWATVTWIAQNPQGETPFPTSIHRPPTSVSGGLQTNTPTATPTSTFTPTATPTATSTGTSTYTPSPGPSATNSDTGFNVPFDDQINNPDWWRLDTGDFTSYADTWNVQWYVFTQSSGTSCSNYTYSYTNKNVTTISDLNGINFNWGSSNPTASNNPSGTGIGVGKNNLWGASFTRTVTVEQTAYYSFTVNSNSNYDFTKLTIDGSVVQNVPCGGSGTYTLQLTKGTHNVQLDYGNNTNNAAVSLTITRQNSNASDVVSGNNSCTWGTSSGANNPVSPMYMFEDNPGQSTWPNGQTCYLELRGYINVTAADVHPILSFWDIWDFAASANVTAQMQIGTYATDASGNPASTNWTTVASRGAHTSNYAWTRSQVDLSSYTATLGSQIAVRFVIGSSDATAPFRWYIDDIEVVDDGAPSTTYTVGQTWNLNSRDQMSQFIYDGDSYDVTSPSGASGSRRWDLTSTHAVSGTAWDDSPVGTSDPTGVYQDINAISPPTGAGNARVHYLEIKYPIDLRTGVAPLQDAGGNTGNPLLTFWQAFDILPNASIRVQYTRDASDPSENLNSGSLETWTDIPNQGVLVDYTVPAGASRTNLTMTPVQIDLTNIPNWNTQPFRLRFALYVDNVASSFGDGWYIDNIAIARDSASPYFAYPFVDDAENSTFFKATWDAIGGEWGQTTEKAGVLNSATAYSDSPLTNYDANTVQMLQMHYAIDLLHDTPADTSNPSDVPAVNPMLSFWMRRSVGSDEVLSVDLWTPHTPWTSVWSYSSASDSSFRTQNAWERVEIDLSTALKQVTGQTLTQLAANGVLDDDDIKIRFNFTSGSSVGYDGVYVDQIQIQDAPTYTHQLWPTSRGGAGNYVDSVEFASPIYSYDHGIGSRWYMGGDWGTTSAAGYTYSGSSALTDSPGGNYNSNTYSVLELYPKIDLTSTLATDLPTMYFWTRYQVGSDDNIQVQIAYQDATTASNANGYDQIGAWSAWTAQPMMIGNSVTDAGSSTLNNTEIDTWERGQVNLASYVGKVIRVRFLVSVPNTSNQADGIYLDDIAFTVGRTQVALPFSDDAQTTANWITEGTWGLGTNFFIGSGTSSADLGSNPWVGTYFDCEPLKRATDSCTSNVSTTMTHILLDNTNYPISHNPPNDVSNEAMIGPEIITDIDFNWGGSNRPLNNTSAQGSPPNPGYTDTFVARWTRQVQLAPGTYSFSTVSDDGVNVWMDDATGTTLSDPTSVSGGTANSRYIIHDWGDHASKLDFTSFTVNPGPPITRTVTVEYYENAGSAVMILNATSSSFSFTDSPNSYTGCTSGSTCQAGFTITPSVYPGDSSLMLNGYFDLSDPTKTPVLSYQRLYDVASNSHFYVEVSTDGGFTWTQLSGETINGLSTRLLPSNDWDPRNVNLNLFKQPNVMIRFRLDTRANSASSPTGDGVYLASIRVSDN